MAVPKAVKRGPREGIHLEDLQRFIKVVENKTYRQAVRVTKMSLDKLRQTIMKIQRYYGVQVFQTGKYPRPLTPAGQELYDFAKKVCGMEAKLKRSMDKQRKVSGTLYKVGIASPEWVKRDYVDNSNLLQRAFEVPLHAKWWETAAEGDLRKTLDGKSTFFLSPTKQNEGDGYENHLAVQESWCLVGNLDDGKWYPGYSSEPVLRMVGYLPGSALQMAIENVLDEQKIPCHWVAHLEDPWAVRMAIDAGSGCGVIPPRFVGGPLTMKAKFLFPINIYLVCKTRRIVTHVDNAIHF